MYCKRMSADKAADVELLTALMRRCAGYKLQTFGSLPVAEEGLSLLHGFPAECAADDRLVWGLFEKAGPLFGVMQVARAYPRPELAHIGLLLLDPQHQRHHAGREALEHISRQARHWPGVERWQLSVLDSNQSALQFWRHCGFNTVSQHCTAPGLLGSGSVMERPIKHKPSCLSGRPVERDEALHARHLLAVLR